MRQSKNGIWIGIGILVLSIGSMAWLGTHGWLATGSSDQTASGNNQAGSDPQPAHQHTTGTGANAGTSGGESAPASTTTTTTTPSPLQAVRALSASTSADQAYQLFLQVKNWLADDPGAIEVVKNELLHATGDTADTRRQMSLLYGALAESNRPESAVALTELLRSTENEEGLVQAAAALGDHRQPPAAALEALWSEVQKPKSETTRNIALLAYGSAANHSGAANTEVTTQLLKLGAASGDGQANADTTTGTNATTATSPNAPSRVEVLAAMGNHGSVDYLPFIRESAQSPVEAVRAAALYGTRFMPGHDLAQWVADTAVKDSSEKVKAEAVRSLQFNMDERQTYEQMANVALSSNTQETQLNAARKLLQQATTAPQAKAALAELLQKTTFQAVRDLVNAN